MLRYGGGEVRAVPPELADRIESGAAGLCHVWLVRRTDGSRSGFTDHDRDLTVDGVVCRRIEWR
ncbi:MAG TPA: DUF2163 domain-containing protein [Caulobacteraceae bacterium]|nr:DUF2163 domain-containing protein [Caulobacteraceae bacterium]